VELSEVDEQGVALLTRGGLRKGALRRNPERSFLLGTHASGVQGGIVSQHAGGVRTSSSCSVSQAQRNDLLQQRFIIDAAMLG
jgi:hypothetical protein